MNHYQYLENICKTYPKLFNLETEVFSNKLSVRLRDCDNNIILHKDVECSTESIVEDLKDRIAFDLISSMIIQSFSTARKFMMPQLEKIKAIQN